MFLRFLFLDFYLFLDFTYKWDDTVFDLFHLAQCPQGSPMFL